MKHWKVSLEGGGMEQRVVQRSFENQIKNYVHYNNQEVLLSLQTENVHPILSPKAAMNVVWDDGVG